MSGFEREYKYRITSPITPADVEAAAASFPLGPRTPLVIADTILDTVDEAVIAARCAFRLRETNGALVATFKGPRLGGGELHARQEIELPLSGECADAGRWPPVIAAALNLLEAGLAEREFGPIVRVRNQRTIWLVGSYAEIALDDATLIAADREERIAELEIEEKDPDPAAFEALRAALTARLPLAPEPRTKLERALALRARS